MAESELHRHTPSELKEQLDAERRGLPFLVFRDETGKQCVFNLADRGRVDIGRSEESDLRLPWDGDVSRVHAALERVGAYWTLVDDGLSRNGSFVNAERVQGRRRLVDGDRLQFGGTSVTFRAPGNGVGGTTTERTDVVVVARLTDAQRRVLTALARPRVTGGSFAAPASNQQIADELVLSVAGVKTHLRTLFEKFAVEDLPQNQKRSRLVELALQSGAVTLRDVSS
jgi:pSer/pThr/pTyr-binding forkhead associated (FHA) protein